MPLTRRTRAARWSTFSHQLFHASIAGCDVLMEARRRPYRFLRIGFLGERMERLPPSDDPSRWTTRLYPTGLSL